MTPQEIDEWLARSLDDRRFSRGERQALGEFLATLGSATDRETVRHRAFEIARAAMVQPDQLPVLDWLEAVTKAIREVGPVTTRPVVAEAFFSPGDDCPRAIGRLLAGAGRTADICVFTITDDRLADAILDAHRRGTAVRIITDDAKAEDLGSSIDRDAVRRRAFEIARSALGQPDDLPVLDWLEGVIKTIREVGKTSDRPAVAEAYFSPGDDCPRAIGRLLANASKTADICVFTITDDRLADAVLDAHRRRVAVRIITDDAKAEDQGSDVGRLERADIATRVDRSPFHMHHKFAILDGATLLTGSYNWTRGAARDNEENLIVTTDPHFLKPFEETFERLWMKLDPSR